MDDTREWITVDLGNSSCKARRWRVDDGARCVATFEHDARPGLGAALAEWLRAAPRDALAGACSVASRELESEVWRALGERRVAALVAGLRSEYRTPETLGADRLFAARGALESVQASCIVVDAGTAVTVDAVRANSRGGTFSAGGWFLGGAIAPGPELLARALHTGTARLPLVAPRAGVPALGRDTRAALEAGVVHGFAGLVRGLVDAVARDAGLERAPVVLGGGAASLLGDDALSGKDLRRVTDLVHLGLLAALQSSRESER